jgi:hypothetical protein
MPGFFVSTRRSLKRAAFGAQIGPLDHLPGYAGRASTFSAFLSKILSTWASS